MTSSLKTSKYSIFLPIPNITGLHVPYEQGSEMEEVFFKLVYILPETHEYIHRPKKSKETSIVLIYYSHDTQNLENICI